MCAYYLYLYESICACFEVKYRGNITGFYRFKLIEPKTVLWLNSWIGRVCVLCCVGTAQYDVAGLLQSKLLYRPTIYCKRFLCSIEAIFDLNEKLLIICHHRYLVLIPNVGCRASALSLEAKSLHTWTTTRHCIITRYVYCWLWSADGFCEPAACTHTVDEIFADISN